MKLVSVFLFLLVWMGPGYAKSSCGEEVDSLQLIYINGMFTDLSGFWSNANDLDQLQNQKVSLYIPKKNLVMGYQNRDEGTVEQLIQVFLQKLDSAGEMSWEELFWRFINGEGIGSFEATPFFHLWSEAVSEYYQLGTDEDYAGMANALSSHLRGCARTILVSHSQGNFYGDGLFSEMAEGFVFDADWPLADYPMLGQMAIATPSYRVGGHRGGDYADLLGNVTNDTDLVMAGVRATVGALPATFSAEFNIHDWTGHGFYDSYVGQPGQSEAIANRIVGIAYSMVPWPMHDQHAVTSSAMDSFGYSKINRMLDIEFVSGGIYRYYDVPHSIVSGLHEAESKGRYFHQAIRDVFEYERLN
ncbi:KTSC domain-containing protein [Ferrimonas balearica]|uniref:KTSC domain-containing protein n=1 Tax=Ferrimonas balearica TaxID=44012 RepID=UPI001C997633|nr:KTSC domain-containing protein [Ferrimonas balearica]MBY5992223.1 KTSC domain-containing protein [Ferrimonas balearica]